MKKLIFALFASFLMMGWSYAQVENNEAVVDQSGFMNNSDVFQDGRNYANVDQDGLFNTSVVNQSGINKAGNGKWGAFVTQLGKMNYAEVQQVGPEFPDGKGVGNKAVQNQLNVFWNYQFAKQNGNKNKSFQDQIGKEGFKSWFMTSGNSQEVYQFGDKNTARQLQKYGLVWTTQLIKQRGVKNKATQKMMGDPNDWPFANLTSQFIKQRGDNNTASQLMKKNVDGWMGSGSQVIRTLDGNDNTATQIMGKSADYGYQIIKQFDSEGSTAYQEQGDDANFNYAIIRQEDQLGSTAEQFQWSDFNEAKIVQLGNSPGEGNTALQEQLGGENTAFIKQKGSFNTAEQYQDGDHDDGIVFGHGLFAGGARSVQIGDGNTSDQDQLGGTQSADIRQVGDGHYSKQVQEPGLEEGLGYNRAEVLMKGTENWSEQYQQGFANFARVKTGKNSSGNEAFQYQGVDYGIQGEGDVFITGLMSVHNEALAEQFGEDNVSTQVQFGINNDSYVLQKGNGNDAFTVQHGMCNDADIEQYGNLNDGFISQVGMGNDAEIFQYGNSGSGVITQMGISNYSIITQY